MTKIIYERGERKGRSQPNQPPTTSLSPESPTSASAARGKNGDAALKRQYEEGVGGNATPFTGLLFLLTGGARISHRREFYLWLLVAVLQLAVGLSLGVYRFGKWTNPDASTPSRSTLSRLEVATSLTVATLGVGTIA